MSVTYVSKKGLKDNRRNSVDVPNYNGILIGGSFTEFSILGEYSNRFSRLNSDGLYDDTINVLDNFNSLVRTVTLQQDGKILVGGFFTTYQSQSRNFIIRLNSDGSIDSSFNIGTGFSSFVDIITVQPDGKILVGGDFTTYQGTARNRIIRLNSNGSIDTSFSIGTGFNQRIFTITLQSDGKILIGGQFTTYQGTTYNRIIRLNSDGSVDNTFSIGTGFGGTVLTITLQPDGKILAGGGFTTYQGITRNYIIRLNSDGSVDNTFSIGTGFNNSVNTIVLQPDGKILVGGDFTLYQGTTYNRIIRLNSDGSIDTSFNIGSGFDNSVSTITLQSDGKILIGGSFTYFQVTTYNRIIRLNSNGSVDNIFNIGSGFNGTIVSISLQPDGKILVGGGFTRFTETTRTRTINLTPNRIVAKNFINGESDVNKLYIESPNIFGTGFNNIVNTIVLQSNGKILLGGNFTSYQGTTINYIIRLNSDGNIDNTFNIGTGFNGAVQTITLQSDGKILVGGIFTTYQGITRNYIIRLNSDGSIDNTFNIGTGFNSSVNIITLQSDGKILLGGSFTTYQGTTYNRIIRLNSDGSIDTSFNLGTGFNGTVRTVILQQDGKILVGGDFTTYQGITRNRIIRLNSDGTIDNTFNIGTGFGSNSVTTIILQPDGKILAGGDFATYQGITRNRIIRLNSDGTIDNTFNIGTGFGALSVVRTVALQPDGKILIGGDFITYQGISRNRITRINNDGTLDNTIKLYSNNTVNTIALY